jgi:hypothetical protein
MENLGLLSMRAVPGESYQTATLHLRAEQSAARRLDMMPPEPRPIWLSVLEASSCQAKSRGQNHEIRWQHVSGRATYTNVGSEEERIEPLGINVPRGKTIAVSWLPGQTEYTVEVYKR